jgi:hypothetical protein
MIHILYYLTVGLVTWCFVGLVISTMVYLRLVSADRRASKDQGGVNKDQE